jgi:hypothetical protein
MLGVDRKVEMRCPCICLARMQGYIVPVHLMLLDTVLTCLVCVYHEGEDYTRFLQRYL